MALDIWDIFENFFGHVTPIVNDVLVTWHWHCGYLDTEWLSKPFTEETNQMYSFSVKK